MTVPLWELGKTHSKWYWDSKLNKTFQNMKNAISLKCYKENKEITLQVNASQTTAGAVLLQEGTPMVYRWRALTPVQQNCAQIEKELFAVITGSQQFH